MMRGEGATPKARLCGAHIPNRQFDPSFVSASRDRPLEAPTLRLMPMPMLCCCRRCCCYSVAIIGLMVLCLSTSLEDSTPSSLTNESKERWLESVGSLSECKRNGKEQAASYHLPFSPTR